MPVFVDLSSAFNTIIPALLHNKLSLTPPAGLQVDSLSGMRQPVNLEKHVSDSLTISTSSPQGCVLSFLLLSLYSNSSISVKLQKSVDDTTLIGS